MPKSPPLTSLICRRRWTTADARSVLAALTRSGLSASEFAVREGLDTQRLHRWRRRLDAMSARTPAIPTFVELWPRRAEMIEVVLGSGRVLRASEAIEPSALGRFVDALERPSPC
jgi:transposase